MSCILLLTVPMSTASIVVNSWWSLASTTTTAVVALVLSSSTPMNMTCFSSIVVFNHDRRYLSVIAADAELCRCL